MRVVYNPLALEYLGSKRYGESSKRLEGIENVGQVLEPPINGEDFLHLAHSRRHINKIRQICQENRRIAYIPTSTLTFQAACESVAISVIAAQQGYFIATRPPGHHAGIESSSGFCVFNNIAIATQNLLNQGEKVCILDIDAHQGNGTEEIFQKSSNVLFCSTHREFGWPSRDDPNIKTEEIDKSVFREGSGLVYNMPLPIGSGDDIFLDWWGRFSKIVRKFEPDYIAISAGFDGYKNDPIFDGYNNPKLIGGLRISKRGFYEFGRLVSNLGSKVFAILEGGYHDQVVSCIDSFVSGVNGESLNSNEGLTKSSKIAHRKYDRTLRTLEKRI